jgi:hypothetical protein
MATPRTPAAKIGRIPVVLAAAALGELVPAWRTIALTLTELGAAAFFISGTVTSAIGESAPWFVLAAVVAGTVLRAADVESWALFMPGGLPGRVNEAFGRRPARFAAAAVLVERLFFAALVAGVAGHYTVSVLISGLGLSRLAEHVAASDSAAAAAASIIGILWIRSRVGRRVGPALRALGVGAARRAARDGDLGPDRRGGRGPRFRRALPVGRGPVRPPGSS